jgi:hypothetical protein
MNFANLLGRSVNPDFLNTMNFKTFQSHRCPSRRLVPMSEEADEDLLQKMDDHIV